MGWENKSRVSRSEFFFDIIKKCQKYIDGKLFYKLYIYIHT